MKQVTINKYRTITPVEVTSRTLCPWQITIFGHRWLHMHLTVQVDSKLSTFARIESSCINFLLVINYDLCSIAPFPRCKVAKSARLRTPFKSSPVGRLPLLSSRPRSPFQLKNVTVTRINYQVIAYCLVWQRHVNNLPKVAMQLPRLESNPQSNERKFNALLLSLCAKSVYSKF